ncbi:hypothetical protein M427DRAFT_31674 [Gonapodya prolifera JEL478]|uniref:F-box domain-containing protein n=1 Tax=Gonapodya prolifera (strain JEL478) TaxID=1344416 RepID=A0A139AH22_GONPJ|nr:hypothetical protein M427DRAFT_31674 [Gonapodya prolifera JEL478]|eukprot:KXS16111.1 hypothetical protein M427DRAFT_31674 [Gonapodya prolifera JEL478]
MAPESPSILMPDDSMDMYIPPSPSALPERVLASDLVIPNLPCSASHNYTPSSPRKRFSPTLPFLPTSASAYSLRSAARKRAELLTLPNEVLLSVVGHLPARDMAQARRVSRRIKCLAEVPLSRWTVERIRKLRLEVKEARTTLTYLRHRKLPLLRHYRSFLRNPTATELSELASHPNPPRELRIVAACLLALHGSLPSDQSSAFSSSSSLPDSTTSLPVDHSWPTLRRALLNPSFRRWLRLLPNNVDSVPTPRVAQVDALIVSSSLTYERARASSMAAYRLLIVVAAALQVRHLGEELEEAEGKVERVRGRWAGGKTFAGYLGVDVEEQEEMEEGDLDSGGGEDFHGAAPV